MPGVEEKKCKFCDDPLVILATHEYKISFENGRWNKDVGVVIYECNNCHVQFGTAEIADILRQVDEL